MYRTFIFYIVLFASFSIKADVFDFFKSNPVKVVSYRSTNEILKRINSIVKSAEHCSRARVHYYSTGRQMRGGESACDDYYDWEKNFYPHYKITKSSYKTNEVKAKLGYLDDLEAAD